MCILKQNCMHYLFRKINPWLDSTGANDRSFYFIFNKRFDHLETLLTIHRPKNVFLTGAFPAHSLIQMPQNGPSYYPKSVMLQFQICYYSKLNVSQKAKTNINFRSQVCNCSNSSFHVKQRTTRKVQFLFFRGILLLLTKFLFWEEG